MQLNGEFGNEMGYIFSRITLMFKDAQMQYHCIWATLQHSGSLKLLLGLGRVGSVSKKRLSHLFWLFPLIFGYKSAVYFET